MAHVIAPAVKNTATPIQGDTLLVYLIDRSGSMQTCWEETIGGINTDIKVQQKDDDGKTEVAFYFFDGSGWGDKKTNLVKQFEGALADTMTFSQDDAAYSPHGSTPLYDAVGQMIMEVKDRVEVSDDNPNVLVSIFTDGGNTDNHGYSPSDVAAMVEVCQGDGWTFTYFGANQDAWAVGSTFGIAKGNTMSYNTNNMKGMMASASIARSSHIMSSKLSHADGLAYTSGSYFSDAGQTTSDYS
jgi:hypothetical protein